MEKRKKKIIENNIFPPTKSVMAANKPTSAQSQASAYEIYSGGEQDPKQMKKEEAARLKKIIKKTTP